MSFSRADLKRASSKLARAVAAHRARVMAAARTERKAVQVNGETHVCTVTVLPTLDAEAGSALLRSPSAFNG